MECRMGADVAADVFGEMLEGHMTNLTLCIEDTDAAKKELGIKGTRQVSGMYCMAASALV